MAETLLTVEGRGRAHQRLHRTERVAALPDEGPYAGRSADDAGGGPQTFEETNALLEEIARRFADFGVETDPEGPAPAGAPQPESVRQAHGL